MIQWASRYAEDSSEYDWYMTPSEILGLVDSVAGNEDEILYVGCGTSALGEELYKNGKRYVTNIDSCKKVIEVMSKKCAALTDMQYVEMDATRMPRELTGAFQLVIDKALLDTLLCETRKEKAVKYLAEVNRVLKTGGWFCCVSYGLPETRLQLISKAFGVPAQRIRTNTIPKPIVPGIEEGSSSEFFVYTVQK